MIKRFLLAVAVFVLVPGATQAQIDPTQPEDGPSVAHAIPLTYIGSNGRVSMSIDNEGNSTGEALGVFDNTGEHAYIAQAWWGNGGAGGAQVGYNWLWGGLTLRQAKENPERVTVARTMIAADQNMFKDRKATFGFGIERKDYFIDVYLSAAVSGDRSGGARNIVQESTIEGMDASGIYRQIETIITTEEFSSRAYDHGIGVRAGHFSNRMAMRLHGGVDYQKGREGAHITTLSAGVDKYLGRRGWSMTGLVEHDESSTDPLLGGSSDTRFSMYLRYEFGGRIFAPTAELGSLAWVSRAMATPPSAHSRVVQTYKRQTKRTIVTEVGPKEYTNLHPIAADDIATVIVDSGPVLIDVLANDHDPDGDQLTISSVSAAQHGSASIAGNQISYLPNAGYVGEDHFSYAVSDGRGGSGSALVTITLTPRPNRSPVVGDVLASTLYETPVNIDVLASASDPDGDPLEVVDVGQPNHGTVQLHADGTITYTPHPNFSGTDRFSYTISDGRGGIASAWVNVTVAPRPNQPPVAVDDFANTPEGVPVTIDVLANDFDPDGDPLQVTQAGQPTNGTVQIHADGTITYTPHPTFSGTDRFSYTISDGHGRTASAWVTIIVGTVQNRPPNAMDDSATTTQGVPVTIDVLANDSDPDGDPLQVTHVGLPDNGTVQLHADGTITYSPYMGATGAFIGTDRFIYTISDGHGGTASAWVTITVLPVNRPPIAVDDFATTRAAVPVTINVLANDSDPDGDPLQVTLVGQPDNGTVQLHANGTVTYTPGLDTAGGPFLGTDRFSYTISDGRGGTDSAWVYIDVTQ